MLEIYELKILRDFLGERFIVVEFIGFWGFLYY